VRIYFDVSCLNRPFDDQRPTRVRLEAEAVTLIFERIDAGRWRQVSSQIAEIEIAAISDVERRRRVRVLLPGRKERVALTRSTFARAGQLAELGLKPADALHVAAAESSKADVLLTCDDRLYRRARRLRSQLRVRVDNPLSWLQENADAPDT